MPSRGVFANACTAKFSAFPSGEAHISVVSCGWMLQCLKHLALRDVTRSDVCQATQYPICPFGIWHGWPYEMLRLYHSTHVELSSAIPPSTTQHPDICEVDVASSELEYLDPGSIVFVLDNLSTFLFTTKKIHFIPRLLRNHNKKRPTCSYLWIFEVVYWWHSRIQKTLLSNISKILEVNYRILQGRSNSKLNKGPVDEGVPRFRRSFLNGVSYNRNKWVYLALFHPENSLDLFFAPTYNWCLWARKVHIQEKTELWPSVEFLE